MDVPTSRDFPKNVSKALGDAQLQQILSGMGQFLLARNAAVDRMPEFDELRKDGKGIKDHALEHLDFYLEAFEKRVVAQGGEVHWARDSQDACDAVINICRKVGARKILKGKSMITEEIDLNYALDQNGFDVLETDLGEYIIQLRGERPSHILAPAMHLSLAQVAESFRKSHKALDPARDLSQAQSLLSEARQVLRQHFFSADVGITGANFLVAETGSAVIVTNEGNGDLSMTLPKVHIVVTSIDKIVATLNDASTLLRLLARSVTGQELSAYTTFVTGPKRKDDADGPDQFHIVLLDNGRSEVLGTEFRDMLRCIRCSACMNHCPVFSAIGGHAYGSVYPGPIGAVIMPALLGLEESRNLPNASTFCGRCDEVCPVGIPLTRMMRYWRDKEFEQHLSPVVSRWVVTTWAFVARRPRLYRALSKFGARLLRILGGRRGHIGGLPLARGWTNKRDLPAPEGKTFHDIWRHKKNAGAGS